VKGDGARGRKGEGATVRGFDFFFLRETSVIP
jgi:hypothetical protein